MRKYYNVNKSISVFFATLFIFAMSSFGQAVHIQEISGQIFDSDNNPIVGATVLLVASDSTIDGIAADNDGNFKLSFLIQDDLKIKIHAVGFEQYIMPIADYKKFNIYMKKKIVVMQPISVRSSQNDSFEAEVTSDKQFAQRTKNSLLTNNPLNAIRQPQLVKQGSSLSSKLRINGTSPEYYYHNLPIGDSPNHYGMFSIIPSSVVKSVKFYPNGTPASYQLPSVIDLTPKQEFKDVKTKSMQFSLVQSTGTYSFGNKNFFTIATLRKSVLDKLVKYLKVESNRRTIPPTNFEDIVISTGYKFNNHSTLYLDQFFTRDFLAYNTGPINNNPFGYETYQHSKNRFTGLTYQYNGNSSLFIAKLSNKSMREEFTATPQQKILKAMDIELFETSSRYNGQFAYTKFYSLLDFETGFDIAYIPKRETKMIQQNWNQTSPDAPSDNPFVYQRELNQLYRDVSLEQTETTKSMYTQVTYEKSNLLFRSGIRLEQFSNFAENNFFLYRNRVTYSLDEKSKISFFVGKFSESPVKNILENYQVLVRANLSALKPQVTNLFSVSYKNKNLQLSLFKKDISQIATPTIDYSKVIPNGHVTDGFITMLSDGELHFIGGDIAYEKNQFLFSKLNMYSFYGYTKASKESYGNKSVYELNTPHKFLMELQYIWTEKTTFGTEFNYHSGFSYTPYISQENYIRKDRYQESYFQNIQSYENSEEFPAYYALNLFLNYSFGETDINFSISNITNRKNPVVKTASGYVYDPGIMPSIGFNWKL